LAGLAPVHLGAHRAGAQRCEPTTSPQLAFQLAHAQARDAVHLPLDVPALHARLREAGVAGAEALPTLSSAARDRLTYLQRPDLGRRLDEASRDALRASQPDAMRRPYDVAFVIADGLSSLAISRNAPDFLAALQARMARESWSVAPLAVVRQGRVAVGDEVGELLGARLLVVLIGERPGLSSPDSMGLYMTWMPRVGRTDAERNCISNVRVGGLRLDDAARKLHHLMAEAMRRQLTGVDLKDESTSLDHDADDGRPAGLAAGEPEA
jgi:ethanolamine ammonia-lyase small subunit